MLSLPLAIYFKFEWFKAIKAALLQVRLVCLHLAIVGQPIKLEEIIH